MKLFHKTTLLLAGALLVLGACSTAPKEAEPTVTTTSSSAPLPGSQEDLEAVAGHRVFFEFDRYDLQSEAQQTLSRQAAWLKANPDAKVLISGNCDERGTREYNLALGARRANAAQDYLISLGIEPSRISTISYGEERPIALGSNEQSWALNRNATTMVQNGPSS